MAAIAGLLERVRVAGPMRRVPMSFVAALMNSVADATMDQMIKIQATQRLIAKTVWSFVENARLVASFIDDCPDREQHGEERTWRIIETHVMPGVIS